MCRYCKQEVNVFWQLDHMPETLELGMVNVYTEVCQRSNHWPRGQGEDGYLGNLDSPRKRLLVSIMSPH